MRYGNQIDPGRIASANVASGLGAGGGTLGNYRRPPKPSPNSATGLMSPPPGSQPMNGMSRGKGPRQGSGMDSTSAMMGQSDQNHPQRGSGLGLAEVSDRLRQYGTNPNINEAERQRLLTRQRFLSRQALGGGYSGPQTEGVYQPGYSPMGPRRAA